MRRSGRGRIALCIGVTWIALVAAVACYERYTVDPWRLVGENRGPVFFTWSKHLVYERSPLGDFELVLRTRRFLLVLLLPPAALAAGALALSPLRRRLRRPRV